MASDYVVASMCGCWFIESGVNPGIWETLIPCDWEYIYGTSGPNRGGYGLGQWTNTRNSTTGAVGWRLRDLHEWVTSNGYRDGDGDGQLAYLIHENHWANSTQTRGKYKSLMEFLNSDSRNIPNLVWDFLANWEGVPGNKYTQRRDKALEYLAYIKLHKNDDPSEYKWVSKNGYLSASETLNNVMCVYFNIGSPSPPRPRKTKHLPIYMMCRVWC